MHVLGSVQRAVIDGECLPQSSAPIPFLVHLERPGRPGAVAIQNRAREARAAKPHELCYWWHMPETGERMDTSDVLVEIRRIAEEEWASHRRPVLLSNLPRSLELSLSQDYKSILADKSLKSFLQDHAQEAGVKIIQDPVHGARVGIIPEGQQFRFPAPPETSEQISGADARAFGRVLASMPLEEQRNTMLPASFVARLLASR